MKKYLFIVIISLIFSYTFAHPGDDLEDQQGCHHCWTNCEDWGEVYGEIHCHDNQDIEYILSICRHEIHDIENYCKLNSTRACLSELEMKMALIYDFRNSLNNFKLDMYREGCKSWLYISYNNFYDLYKKLGGSQEYLLSDTCPNNSYNDGIGSCWCNNGYVTFNGSCIKEVEKNLIDAINRMYSKGLTIYNTQLTFMSDQNLTRQQAAKFFVEFAEQVAQKTINTSTDTTLTDINIADKTLQGHIIKSSQLGIFKGSKGKFLPFDNLTRAQAIAVAIRIIQGSMEEAGYRWYTNYFNAASTMGILDGLGFSHDTLDSLYITRGEVAVLLYRLNLKYQ